MAKELTPTTLSLYREIRRWRTPATALELVRAHLHIARTYALTAGRDTHAGELADEITRVTGWLQDVRLRCDQPARSGRYWQTGKPTPRLEFTVEAQSWDGEILETNTCKTSGCAIKHAIGMLARNYIRSVDISVNRDWPDLTINAGWPIGAVYDVAWPEH